MIQAAKAVFVTMANVTTVRPIVLAYQQKWIDYMRPVVREDMKRSRAEDGGIAEPRPEITSPDQSYMMDDKDAAWYFEKCAQEAAAAGFKVKPGYCPLLIAEDLQRKAEHVLVDAMSDYLAATNGGKKVTVNGLLCLGLAKYRDFIRLTLSLLAPLCGNTADILKEYGIAK